MASPSNDKFCSLDMLAEVASATLQNDPSLTMDFSLSRAKNKVANASPRKCVNSCEKLSLDQIKALSEKNLIEMFSELICDEMKKNYFFKCFLIPDKCTQVYKSFGNEARARCKMKIHLQSHINDLVAAANVKKDHEAFMAEPLHVRRKRLREIKQKNARRRKRIKQLPVKKETNLGLFSTNVDDFGLLKSEDNQFNRITSNSLNALPEVNCTFNTAVNISVRNNMNDNSINQISKKHKSLSYFSPHSSVYDRSDGKVIFKGQSSNKDFPASLKNNVKRKHRSRDTSDTKKRTSGSCEFYGSSTLRSDHDDKKKINPDLLWPVLHDHTYTTIYGKTLNFERSVISESNRSTNRLFGDPFHPKKTPHRCALEELPFIIPTPPFPYVYVPLLPHIALIQEVGSTFMICKPMTASQIAENIEAHYNYLRYFPMLLRRRRELARNARNQSTSNANMIDPDSDENFPSDTYAEEMTFEDGNNNETRDVKLFDSPFYVDDLMRNANPETWKAIKKE